MMLDYIYWCKSLYEIKPDGISKESWKLLQRISYCYNGLLINKFLTVGDLYSIHKASSYYINELEDTVDETFYTNYMLYITGILQLWKERGLELEHYECVSNIDKTLDYLWGSLFLKTDY